MKMLQDFSTAVEVIAYQGESRGSSVAIEPAPGTANPALVLRIAEHHTTLHEANLPKGELLSGAAEVTLRAKLTGAVQAWGIALRVLDDQDRTVQFVHKGVPGTDWSTIAFTVTPGGSNDGAWGGPGSGPLSGSWRVLGLAFMTNDHDGTGELWIDDLSYRSTP